MGEIEEAIDRYLATLRTAIRARGFTQLRVQKRLGWGRSFISQILSRQKGLRLETLLLILRAIDVSPEEFYGELYHWPPLEDDASENRPRFDPPEEVDRVLERLAEKIREKGLTQSAIQSRLDRVVVLGHSMGGPIGTILACRGCPAGWGSRGSSK